MAVGALRALDLSAEQRKTLNRLLRRFVPNAAVWAYGSRVKWTAKPSSDLDLVVLGPTADTAYVADLRDALMESDLPFPVDVHVWDELPASFRQNIEGQHVVIQAAASDLPAPPENWRRSTWGREVCLGCGKSLRGYDPHQGKVRVSGSNGPIGWTGVALAPGPGVVLRRKGAYRGIEFSREPFFVIDTAYYFVPKSDLDMRWLYYAAIADRLGEIDDGSPGPSTTRAAVYMQPIVVPPPSEQRAIADVLESLDAKIEVNRRMNATLEAMARALFQSWFVDFDPVRAKLDGRQPSNLDAATAGLFPAAFQDSPIGPIPQGWFVTTLGQGCTQGGGNIQTGPFGTQLHASDYVDEGIPSIMPSDLRDNRIDTSSIARVREDDARRLNLYQVQTGDVVYSRRGDVERRSLIRSGENGWLCGTGCLRVRFGPRGLNPLFGASHLETLESRAWVVRHAVGATMPNLNTSILGALPMIVPPAELQARFAEIVGPWDERGTIAFEQSRTLSALRGALLPKLLSGELRIPASVGEVPE